ncbi:MarP family serine protease [Corynebacterium hansenii]|uniref:Serine protease n=1 Tax=Corynebacterium hansenii TaxID=394964 RepID=A0ABV7ZNH5_9CORY|nr:MarP family serine protease [Corynebacterium hansenii]WJY98856.1 Serine protease [Corynebacterium hansenii]
MTAAIDGGLVLDVLLILAVLSAMALGWRQGALASALSIIGVIAGGIVGLELAPPAMDLVEGRAARLIIGVAVLIGMVVLGHTVGAVSGQSLRNRMRSPMAVGLDSGFGAVVQAAATLIVAWMVALPLATVLPGQFGDSIRDSAVLATVDEVAPESWAGLPSSIVRRIDDSGVPAAIAPFEKRPVHDATPADPSVIDQGVVDRIRPSIVRVLGEAPQCRRLLQGTGFVIAPDLVVTNAHVVAGVETVRMETVAGMVDARVVHFDPLDDIAILRSWDLPLTPLPWAANEGKPGEGAVVLGFPESGPFTATAARIEEKLLIRGPDIYSASRHDREAYVLRSDVRHGNSGGPLINPRGEALGVVFGAGVNDDQTGYALTAAETEAHIKMARDLIEPADTRECVAQ